MVIAGHQQTNGLFKQSMLNVPLAMFFTNYDYLKNEILCKQMQWVWGIFRWTD